MIYALLAVMGHRLIPICAIHPHRNALSSKAKYRNACWFMSSCQACEITQKLQTLIPLSPCRIRRLPNGGTRVMAGNRFMTD